MREFYWDQALNVSDLCAVEDFIKYYEGASLRELAEKHNLTSLQQKNVILRGACHAFWWATSEKIEQRYIVAGDIVGPWLKTKKSQEEKPKATFHNKKVGNGRIDATQPDDPPRGVWIEK